MPLKAWVIPLMMLSVTLGIVLGHSMKDYAQRELDHPRAPR